jgi:N-acyl-D-aspartate/D-glutamate deacylase
MYRKTQGFLSVLSWMFLTGSGSIFAVEKCDLLLKGGSVQVGDGSPMQIADVAIKNGRILAVGTDLDVVANLTLSCKDLIVCPGFIDLHTHSDDEIIERDTRSNINYLMQGCTTIITGNCGSGHVDVADYLDKVDKAGAGTHVGHLLPHGSLRSKVMGKEDRPPTSDELAQMQVLAEKAMQDGAFGMSTGLIYVPGTFAKTDELTSVAKSIAKYQGIYVSHIRSEGLGLLESVKEAIQIGIDAGLPTHVSHFKASGTKAWGTLHVASAMIEKARSEGRKVTADQYPYVASSTSLEASLLPDWARAGGRSALKKRLDDPNVAAKIRSDIVKSLKSIHRIQLATYSARRDWVGKSLDEIAKAESMEVADVVLEIERTGGASVVNFGMNEEDVRMAMQLPWVATASDGSAKTPSANLPHPRSYGTFPRKIGEYALSEQTLPLELAIRSATSLPAEIIGLTDRGLLKSNMIADITIFDPKTFRDRATYEQPFLSPVGLKHVLVQGELAVYEGLPTGALAGRAIRKGSSPKSP